MFGAHDINRAFSCSTRKAAPCGFHATYLAKRFEQSSLIRYRQDAVWLQMMDPQGKVTKEKRMFAVRNTLDDAEVKEFKAVPEENERLQRHHEK
jgi:hypothetical protein